MRNALICIFILSLQLACTKQTAVSDKQSNEKPQTKSELQSSQGKSSQNQDGTISSVSDVSLDTLNEKQREIEIAVKSYGYRITERVSGVYQRWDIFEKWEITQFELQAKRVIKIKSSSPIKGHPDYYYRFAIWVEVYANENKAQERVKRVHDVPPDASAEDRYYFMSNGFQDRNIVYIVETDAAMFFDELGRFTKKLEKAIKEERINKVQQFSISIFSILKNSELI